MNELDFKYHWDNLGELDPDQLASDLNLTAAQIRDRFTAEATEFIFKEFG